MKYSCYSVPKKTPFTTSFYSSGLFSQVTSSALPGQNREQTVLMEQYRPGKSQTRYLWPFPTSTFLITYLSRPEKCYFLVFGCNVFLLAMRHEKKKKHLLSRCTRLGQQKFNLTWRRNKVFFRGVEGQLHFSLHQMLTRYLDFKKNVSCIYFPQRKQSRVSLSLSQIQTTTVKIL